MSDSQKSSQHLAARRLAGIPHELVRVDAA